MNTREITFTREDLEELRASRVRGLVDSAGGTVLATPHRDTRPAYFGYPAEDTVLIDANGWQLLCQGERVTLATFAGGEIVAVGEDVAEDLLRAPRSRAVR